MCCRSQGWEAKMHVLLFYCSLQLQINNNNVTAPVCLTLEAAHLPCRRTTKNEVTPQTRLSVVLIIIKLFFFLNVWTAEVAELQIFKNRKWSDCLLPWHPHRVFPLRQQISLSERQ